MDPKPYNYINYANTYGLPFSQFDKDRPMTLDYQLSRDIINYIAGFKFN